MDPQQRSRRLKRDRRKIRRHRLLLLPLGVFVLVFIVWNCLLIVQHHTIDSTANPKALPNDATAQALKEFKMSKKNDKDNSSVKDQTTKPLHGIETNSTTAESKEITSRNITDSNITSSNNKPYFILHVGPPKTATTTIQCGLHHYSQQLALNHSYYFVGKQCASEKSDILPNGEQQIPGHHLMMGLIYDNPTSRGVEKLKDRLTYHHHRHNNIIFSLEAMAGHLEDKPEVWKALGELLQEWNVRIVISYRHYFDWIRSMYYQSYIGNTYLRWPHEKNGQKHPSFQEYLEYHLLRFDNGDIDVNDPRAFGQHMSLSSYRKFSKHFDDVQVFNLHQQHQEDVFTNFICQMLPPPSTTVCQTIQAERSHPHHSDSNSTTSSNKNVHRVSDSFDADRIAFEAYNQKIIDGHKISKKALVKKIKEQLIKTEIDSNIKYQMCLPEPLLQRFLNASLMFERDLTVEVNEHYTEGSRSTMTTASSFHRNETNHRLQFQEAVQKRKFCEIDPMKVLQNDTWIDFFSNY